MIIGLGLDLCGINRMRQHVENSRFLDRYFSPDEKDYILSRGGAAADSLAASFAAKEALSKALGCGISGLSLDEIEVLRDDQGAPYYRLSGRAMSLAQQKGVIRTHLSISHEGDMAAAVALLEGSAP